MLAAEGDYAHAQLLALALYANVSITGFPLIVVGLIDVHWDQEGHSVSTPWQRTINRHCSAH